MKIIFKLFLIIFLFDFNFIDSCQAKLINSVISKDKDGVKHILKLGCNPNFKNKAGAPILILAIYNGDFQIIKYLLESGADPNSSIYNVKALKFAKNLNRKDIEGLLLSYGAKE